MQQNNNKQPFRYYIGAGLLCLLLVAAVLIWRYDKAGPSAVENAAGEAGHEETFTTEFRGDTAIVRHQGQIVFLRVGDSVLVDELSKILPSDTLQHQE